MVDIALYSLHHQTFSDFEVIITDDYDDEDLSCKTIVKKYQDERFIYVHPPDDPVLGMCGNWEYGLQFASGRYVGFMQDKMYMYSDTLQSLHTCIQEEKMPDMLNWGWDFYSLYQMDGKSFEGKLDRRLDTVNKWEKCDPKAAIAKKLDFPNGNFQDHGGIPGCGSLLGGVIRAEILHKIKDTYGSVFNFFNPDYGPPLLILSYVKTLVFFRDNLYVMIPLSDSEGIVHSISYAAACKFQELSPCGIERLQYATVPHLRITNTNMISADYNYTMHMLSRSERCNEENVFKGIIREAECIRYDTQEDYQRENERIKKACQKRNWEVVKLPQDTRGGAILQCVNEEKKGNILLDLIRRVIPSWLKSVIKSCLGMPRYITVQYQSPKESVFRQC
ncbi:glycosyltransferase family A protein [Selenomonas sp. oral taxon 920]|uniref:glycosyltransferase family A protein n=1 Tax=Selenomonas sp. oral taxon 920 TaxID=1884263 RepID=UPI001F15920F|nr:glycosyltransferase family A protein [Selenomonas sp. oral taxon 920]